MVMLQEKAANKPLVLDVDGTLLRTDLLFETFWLALGQNPWTCFKTCLFNLARPAKLKQELANLVDLRTDLLPVNPQVKDLLESAKRQGRDVVLASGSDYTLVSRLAKDHGIDMPVIASDGSVNLTGQKKADALRGIYGESGFDYAGDSVVDLPVWIAADSAIIVGRRPGVARQLAAQSRNVTEINGGWHWRHLIKGLRPHQWVKNVLLVLPLIAAHRFDMAGLTLVAMGMLAYSLAASSIYIVNDLLDLEADRLHKTKCNRPFASGKVPISVGMITSLVVGGLSLGIAAFISLAMLWVVALYMALSLAYSLRFKRMRWVDIAALASLYTLRVVAGAIAADVVASGFLIAFIFPMFITLGCVKRLTELTLATSDERLPGRGYGRPDRGDLLNVAGLGAAGALLIFFLYSNSAAAAVLYPTTWELKLALIPIAGWLLRMVLLGWNGKQDYDPIVFAMRDRYGLSMIMVTLTIMFHAATLI